MSYSISSIRSSKLLPYLTAAILGLALFLLAFGSLLLSPGWNRWIYMNSREQYEAAWLAYRHAPWSFPLGHLPNFFYPHGSSIAFMDGVPWYLTFLKLISFALPDPFPAWGWWILLCSILQGVAARALMVELSQKESVRWLGTLFLTFSPVLIFRNEHFALMAHWLILFSWSLFFRADQSGRTRWLWAGLVTLTAGIHPYLTVMILPVRVGALLFSKAAIKERIADLIATVAIVGVIFFIFGYFANGTAGDAGADHFSADLATFLMSFNTSSLWPPIFGKNGEDEGYAYLGIGVMLLVCVMLVRLLFDLRKRRISRKNATGKIADDADTFIRRRAAEGFIIAGALVLYSFGPYLRWFGAELSAHGHFHNPLYFFLGGRLGQIALVFRAPGRFTWPFYYLLIAFAVREASFRILITCAAAAVQIMDIGPYVLAKHARFHSSPMPSILSHPSVVDEIRHSSEIIMIPLEPRFMCGLQPVNESVELMKGILLATAHNDIPLNSGLQARLPADVLKPLCEEQMKDFSEGHYKKNATYIVDNQYLTPDLDRRGSPLACRHFDHVSVCSPRQRR